MDYEAKLDEQLKNGLGIILLFFLALVFENVCCMFILYHYYNRKLAITQQIYRKLSSKKMQAIVPNGKNHVRKICAYLIRIGTIRTKVLFNYLQNHYVIFYLISCWTKF